MLDYVTHLFRLKAIIEEGSLGRAARRLNVTQPALSRSVSQLEKHFGQPILIRHSRGVEPTPFGERVLSSALGIERHWHLAEKLLQTDPAEGKTSIRIGAGPIWRGAILPEFVNQLQKDFPKVVFELLSIEPRGSLRDLKEGRLDFIFTGVDLTPGGEPGISVMPFARILANVVGRKNHPIFRHRGPDGTIAPIRLLDFPWVIYSAMPNYRDMMRHAIYEHLGVEPEVRVVCDGLLPTLRLLELGDFLAVMPHSVINRDLTPNLTVVPAGLTPRRNTAAVFYRSEMDDWEIVQAIRRLCLQRFGPLENQNP